MRNFKLKSECPFIFASTYTADSLVKEEGLTQDERILKGYNNQCKEVQKELEIVLENFYKAGKWVIVEGVHLTSDFIIKMMKTYKNCFGAIICVRNSKAHARRFISRTTNHSIDPADNKYVANLDKIRLIQQDLIAGAEKHLIPIINNSNLDSSIKLVHMCFLKYFKIMKSKDTLVDNDTARYLLEEFFKNKSKFDSQNTVKNEINQIKNEATLGADYQEHGSKLISKDAQNEKEEKALAKGKIGNLFRFEEDNDQELEPLAKPKKRKHKDSVQLETAFRDDGLLSEPKLIINHHPTHLS